MHSAARPRFFMVLSPEAPSSPPCGATPATSSSPSMATPNRTYRGSTYRLNRTNRLKSNPKRQLIPAANYKQCVRDTFTDRESGGGDLYTMAEACQKFNYTYGRFYNLRLRYSIPCVKANATKFFPKAEVDKAMAPEAERPGSDLSEHRLTVARRVSLNTSAQRWLTTISGTQTFKMPPHEQK